LPALSWFPGAEACPAGGVLGGGEDAHVRAELGDQDLGGALVHAADGVEARERLGEGRHGAIDLSAHGHDGLVQVVKVGEELADEKGVVGAEVAEQGLSQGGQLRTQLATGEIREDCGIGDAGHQSLEHGPSGGTEQARRDRGELDAGVFEHLVEAVGVARALLDEEFPVAGEITELADRRGRDEAGPNEAALEELGDPGGVVEVRLAARDLGDVGRVGQDAGKSLFEDVEDRGQYTPVLSIATWVTRCASSHSRNIRSSAVVVPKVRTCWARSPLVPGTRTQAVTVFLCTLRPAHRSSTRSMAPPPRRE
jgi:hypothetical protein